MKLSALNIFLLLIIGTLGLITTSCGKNKNTNFSVEGKIENLPVTEIYAIKEITSDSLSIDTIQISKDGEFSFKGEVIGPTMASLFCGQNTEPVSFFLEPNYNVKIKGDITQPDLIEIKGGSVNDDIQDFKSKNINLLQSRSRILSKHENLDPAELKNINLQIARNVRDYVERNPAKIASVVLMNEYSINNISAELLGTDIGLLKGSAADFYLTTALRAYYDRIKISAVGAVAPPITLKNTKGKTVSLSDFKGKPVLLVFDLKDAPADTSYFNALKDAQKKLNGKVTFISIVIDENEKSPDPKTVKIANSLNWTVLLDGKKWNSKEVKKYNIRTAPYMLLISPEGIIEERDVSLDSLVVQFSKETKKINN